MSIGIIDDALVEPLEQFVVQLDQAAIQEVDQAVVSITDNDGKLCKRHPIQTTRYVTKSRLRQVLNHTFQENEGSSWFRAFIHITLISQILGLLTCISHT